MVNALECGGRSARFSSTTGRTPPRCRPAPQPHAHRAAADHDHILRSQFLFLHAERLWHQFDGTKPRSATGLPIAWLLRKYRVKMVMASVTEAGHAIRPDNGTEMVSPWGQDR